MIIRTIPSTWIAEEEHRLDCGPFVKGAIEARKRIESLKYPKDHLVELTRDGINGIYHVGQDKLVWAKDETYGIPFLGSADILKAEFSYQPFISKKQVAGNYLFQCPEGTTLITRSGTIGRMSYMRKDMEDTAISQDVLKVVPDTDKVKPGYLFTLLTSKYGVPIVTGGLFGSIIVHIEAENIADLPVPRLGAVEDQAHSLVQQAADLRAEANKTIVEAIAMMERESGLRRIPTIANSGIGFGARAVSSTALIKRMDASFHSPFHENALCSIRSISVGTNYVRDIAESIFEPKRFKRVQIDDEEYGIPMFGTTALMWADPQPSFLIPKSMTGIDELIVDTRTVLIPRSGQVSGIIGTAVLPYGKLIGGAVSEHAIRINCRNEVDAGYLFVTLRSEYGRRQLKSRAYGSSIPSLDVDQVGQVLVPDLRGDIFEKIGALGLRSAELRSQAIDLENEARALVEHTIEEGGR